MFPPMQTPGNMFRRFVCSGNFVVGSAFVRELSTFPPSLRIVEVGPRDGLQNEPQLVPTEVKIEFIDKLSKTGLRNIEATAFVSPKWVPQMGDNKAVMEGIARMKPVEGLRYSALTPNMNGYQQALASGMQEVAVFGAASEEFSQKNINCSISESLSKFHDIMAAARRDKILVRGYVSTVLGCPYSGKVDPQVVVDVASRLMDMGCYEISLGDTIGVGTPGSTKTLLDLVLKKFPASVIAVHFHDTYGQAIANIFTALQMGISVVDSSVAGLGGCPYARGASGNVSTEDVVYLCQGLGVTTNVDMDSLLEAGEYICTFLGRQSRSKVAVALLANRRYH